MRVSLRRKTKRLICSRLRSTNFAKSYDVRVRLSMRNLKCPNHPSSDRSSVRVLNHRVLKEKKHSRRRISVRASGGRVRGLNLVKMKSLRRMSECPSLQSDR